MTDNDGERASRRTPHRALWSAATTAVTKII